MEWLTEGDILINVFCYVWNVESPCVYVEFLCYHFHSSHNFHHSFCLVDENAQTCVIFMILTKTREFSVSASKSFSFLSTSTKVQCFFHLPVQWMFWVNRFLQATVAGVSPSQPPCVQVSAVRAVSEYCSHLSSTDRTHVLQPFIGSMVDGLLNVVTLFSTDVIALCLETLCVVLEVVYCYAVGIVFVVGNCDDRYFDPGSVTTKACVNHGGIDGS